MQGIINAARMDFRQLNRMVKDYLNNEHSQITLNNVNGQRYIGDALRGEKTIIINGLPGNDLGMFMDGPSLLVNGNVQDSAANTMNDGLIVVHGNAGDTLGYGMRGGRVYVQGNVGYRAGIHIKAYQEKKPLLVIGGTAGDFLGEYMAGGIVVLFNLENEAAPVGKFCASGMHGGAIFIRGQVDARDYNNLELGHPTEEDLTLLHKIAGNYEEYFKKTVPAFGADDFVKIAPHTKRPYGKLYAGI